MSSEAPASNRGGPRPGAGRKPKPDALRPGNTVSVALRDEQRAYVDGVAAENSVTTSEAVRIVIEESRARYRGSVGDVLDAMYEQKKAAKGAPKRTKATGTPLTPEAMAKRMLDALLQRTGLVFEPTLAAEIAQAATKPLGAAKRATRRRDGLAPKPAKQP